MQGHSPFFSIVIPTLNEENFLPHLLKDLSEQGFRDFEVILIDSHSEDCTVNKAKEFTDKLPKLIIKNSKVRNVSSQRNQGAALAQGKYIIFIDADSGFPNYFLSGLHYRLESKKTDIFTCWCSPDSADAITKTTTNTLNIVLETSYLLDSPFAFGSLIGTKRDIFTSIGGFDPQISFAEDVDFIGRAHKLGYNFHIFRDPRFIFSMRRFKQTGALKAFRLYVNLHLKRLLGASIDQKKEYPMGGFDLITDKPTENLIKRIVTTLDTGKKFPAIVKKIKAIITLSEED